MKVAAFVFAAILASASALSLDDVPTLLASTPDGTLPTPVLSELFELWSQRYPGHGDLAMSERHSNFIASLKRVFVKNANPADAAVYSLTKFSDLSVDQFRDRYLMTKKDGLPDLHETPGIAAALAAEPVTDLADSFDWRNTSGVVTPIKNQGGCGSCWAFSATETMESIWALGGNTLVALAPQQIVDCDTNMFGCDGGWPANAFQYAIKAGGMESEAEYPYTGEDGTCEFNITKVVATFTGWRFVTKTRNETEMAVNLQAWGPISICVDADSWLDYQSGTIMASSCGDEIDHCVQITGWGNMDADNGVAFWNVRNSWGPDWGMDGYLQLQYGENTCALAEHVTSVITGDNPSTTSSGNSGMSYGPSGSSGSYMRGGNHGFANGGGRRH